MTENVLCAETKKQLTYQVCGIRDGIRFRFAGAEALAVWEQEKAVFDAVTEKVKTLAPLLKEGSFVEIAGVDLCEAARIRLEQLMCQMLNQMVCVRHGKVEKLQELPAQTVHYGTVRGGMCIQSDGDLTVVGDVHIGARLVAGGSITVLGALCGAAWAGQKGNEKARIAAWKLCASEMRIATAYIQMPKMKKTEDKLPEYAYLRGGLIEVLQYNTKK